MNNVELKILDSIKRLTSEVSHPKILLGLSGGPDSVFLFHILLILRQEGLIDFIVAHLDHEWRDSSIIDYDFSKRLCYTNNVPFFGAKASELNLNIKKNGSKEDLGRKIRRYFFDLIAKENNADFIFLAHHLNDQEETFFLRLIRGSSLAGLVGISPKKDKYVRPMLDISKCEILDYLHSRNINYVKDITNDSEEYLRNRIRKNIIPSFEASDLRFHKKFSDSLKLLAQENQFLENLAFSYFDKVFSINKDNKLFIGDLNYFLSLDSVLQRRIVIVWLCRVKVPFSPSIALINEILKFLNSKKGGSHSFYQNWKIIKKKKLFWIDKA